MCVVCFFCRKEGRLEKNLLINFSKSKSVWISFSYMANLFEVLAKRKKLHIKIKRVSRHKLSKYLIIGARSESVLHILIYHFQSSERKLNKSTNAQDRNLEKKIYTPLFRNKRFAKCSSKTIQNLLYLEATHLLVSDRI